MNSKPEIIYCRSQYFESFNKALGIVADEKVYIEMIDRPDLTKTISFQNNMIEKNWPAYYAIENESVIGWCDVSPFTNPRLAHRGGLGMGCLPGFRGKGIGSLLLEATLNHSKKIGLEKVELNVYTSNLAAIKLYEKFGFEVEGTIKKYRKLDGQYFDCLCMGKFL